MFGLALLFLLGLGFVWQYFIAIPQQTQARFDQLMYDVRPVLKRKNAPKKSVKITIKPDQTSGNKPTSLPAFHARLTDFDTRFSGLNPAHLHPCQREDLYRNWAALRHWTDWADKQAKTADLKREYEQQAIHYTGYPVSFAAIVARGEKAYKTTSEELSQLEARIMRDYAMDIDSFAARAQNYSLSEPALTARFGDLITTTEAAFAGGFAFANTPKAIPKAGIKTKLGYGPNFAIASYQRDNTMVVYWDGARYNHLYDTMLVVHELYPGHHLQMKLEKVRACGTGPIASSTPFIEGWATYAEFLADERGLFEPPDQRLGWLDYRLMRAMRIILDTKRAEQGLSETDAKLIWAERMPPRLQDDFAREWARVNTSRHHLSYVFGSDAIMEARTTLKAEMGADFNEQAFHAALLNMPLKSLLFLPQRIRAQMLARESLASPTLTYPTLAAPTIASKR